MSQYDERRRFSRILFQTPVTLRIADRGCQCTLIDLSLKGILLKLPENCKIKAGDRCQIDIPLGEEVDQNQIRMTAHLSHQSRRLAGFTWTDIDLESFTLLRELMEANLGDPQLVDRELSALIRTHDK